MHQLKIPFFKIIVCCLLSKNLAAQTYVSKIDNLQTYQKLKGKPLSDKFSNIESVKVVYDLNRQKLYFFDSTKIKLHFDFVNEYLGYDKGLQQFNDDNYSTLDKNRDFLLGNLNHIKATDKWILELAASDLMSVPKTEFFFNLIANAVFAKNQLKFYLNNQEKIVSFEHGLYKIACIKSDYIFCELQYQQIAAGTTTGILKKYTLSDLKSIKPAENEIIILDGTPDVLPNVRAMIVNELQTPLSHLVILGKNRKIPIMAFKKVFTDKSFQNLENSSVELKVESDTFYLKKSILKSISKQKQRFKKLSIDTIVNQIVDLSSSKNHIKSIGSKAQNLAFLIFISKNQNFKTPENALAIPFYFYRKHIQDKEISSLIENLLISNKTSLESINSKLKKIRQKIIATKIDTNLILSLNNKLQSKTIFKNFRFRSSTNAEDIDGFSGAGLYDSKTGIIGDSIKTFEKAIKTVWASVWNEAAFWERELYKIDQKNIAMGVLVHRSFPEEEANGVIISKNLMRDSFPGITVNIQKGENSVVKPAIGEVCEQFTVYDFENNKKSKNYDVDYVSHSSLNNNKPILYTEEINSLYKTTKYIEQKMQSIWGTSKPIDLEFKYIGTNRELYIKQVRIFND